MKKTLKEIARENLKAISGRISKTIGKNCQNNFQKRTKHRQSVFQTRYFRVFPNIYSSFVLRQLPKKKQIEFPERILENQHAERIPVEIVEVI